MASQAEIQVLIDQIVTGGNYPANKMRPLLTSLNNYTNYTTTDPTASDDSSMNYIAMRSLWYNSTNLQLFLCLEDGIGAANWLNITPSTNADAASVIDVTITELSDLITAGDIDIKAQYRITDSTVGVGIRVYGITPSVIDTNAFKEGSWDGTTYVSGEIGLYDLSTDIFTPPPGGTIPSLGQVYAVGNAVDGWDLRMISTSGGLIGVVKNVNFAGSTEIISFGDAANNASTITRGISIGAYANSSAGGSDRIALGKFSGANSTGTNVNAFGFEAGRISKSSNLNAFGYQANFYSVIPSVGIDYINAIGYQAAFDNLGNNVNAIGKEAASNNGATGDNLNAIGEKAGYGNFGSYCNFLGNEAGSGNEGSYVIGIGTNAAASNLASGCIAIGRFSMISNNGTDSYAIGFAAGISNTIQNCVFIGKSAGYDANTATGNSLPGASFVLSNTNLPVFANSTDADNYITVVNGAAAGNTYLYYNTATKSIGAVRL